MVVAWRAQVSIRSPIEKTCYLDFAEKIVTAGFVGGAKIHTHRPTTMDLEYPSRCPSAFKRNWCLRAAPLGREGAR